MNLAWLAAVLRPEDIAPHMNFADADYDRQTVPMLAGTVSGDYYRNFSVRENIGNPDKTDNKELAAVTAVMRCFDSSTIQMGARELRRYIEKANDIASICALTLIASATFSELEDFEACDSLLANALSLLALKSDSERLLQACLLQQEALRRRDSGRSYVEICELVNDITSSLLVKSTFPSFPLSPAVSWKSSETLRTITKTVQLASWTLAPSDWIGPKSRRMPTPTEIIRSSRSEQSLLISQKKSTEYGRYVERKFDSLFRDRSITFGTDTDPDLFYANLSYELYGSGYVFGSRKEAALLRLTRSAEGHIFDPAVLSDALRMLRYANADKTLEKAVEQLRIGGPLEALSRDARQTLAARLRPAQIRTADLHVVRAASELLSHPEAERAFTAVLDLLEAGSPSNVPTRMTAYSSRLETTLRTAAALASAAGKEDVLSEKIRQMLSTATNDDETLDHVFARCIRNLGWSNLSTLEVREWTRWLPSDTTSWPGVATTIRSLAGIKAGGPEPAKVDLESLAGLLGDALQGRPVSESLLLQGVSVVVAALQDLRNAARMGRFGYGGYEPADFAAILIRQGRHELWPALIEFFQDPSVPRSFKTPGYDRLLGAQLELSDDYRQILRSAAFQLVNAPDPGLINKENYAPYPAALRFLDSVDIFAEGELLSLLNRLCGIADPEARVEAARSIALMTRKWPTTWILSLAIQLSYDSNSQSKAYAASAIADVARSQRSLQNAAESRLIELLRSDGVLIPLLAIRGIAREGGTAWSADLRSALDALSQSHPSYRVRAEAEAAARNSVGQ
ncbi:hypothetical protein EUA04_19650 [Mycolicibacterium obuense]|uniref:Uncharacterized protein n=1 Tax=Mycolicibacterium obuense TaxID=1807 RepID=A0A4R5X344_9MYCO|nr:hypothetical protein [Mycolicibacterium obuense]TDL05751.1 hypothetical protein EUA04_19650 [Mycolicibacterium obuense]